MFRVGILADLHLPSLDNTVIESAFDWALDEAKRRRLDLIAGAGDMTGLGTLAAARRLRSKLDAAGIPFLLTPGNAERRSPGESRQVAEILSTRTEQGPVRMIDTSHYRISDPDRIRLRQLAGRNLLLVTHIPPDQLDTADQALLSNPSIGLLVAGHLHLDRESDIIQLVRGLDPDKAIGGAPSLTVFTRDGDEAPWTREDVVYPPGDPRQWPEAERREWFDHLGISGMESPLQALREAADLGVPAFELRYRPSTTQPTQELATALSAWRARGKHLSLHVPDLAWKAGAPHGLDELRQAMEQALRIRADAITFHVPRVPVGEFDAASDNLLQAAVEILTPLKQAGIMIGIENLHMNRWETPDSTRGFGYTPDECRQWIDRLRAALGYPLIGLHLDIGHARNNAPYASAYPLSVWYARLGHTITGLHLHQVHLAPDSSFENHKPLTSLFGGVISLSSLFLAWRDHSLNHAPLYLEIRGETGIHSLQALRRELNLSP